MIVWGVQADPELLKAEANALHNTIDSISGPNGMTSEADCENVKTTLDRVFESVLESTMMDCTAWCHPSLTLVFLQTWNSRCMVLTQRRPTLTSWNSRLW